VIIAICISVAHVIEGEPSFSFVCWTARYIYSAWMSMLLLLPILLYDDKYS
jgi:hypothetical protein